MPECCCAPCRWREHRQTSRWRPLRPTLASPARQRNARGTDRFPDKPSLPLALTIPAEPIGFSAPGPIYLGARNSLASLDFLDENRLLFTFRVPGLLRREEGAGDYGHERQIRAVVVALPEGKVESEALWTVHDRVRYLWMLKDGHFLLRDRDSLQEGDAKLELMPLLQFPGPMLWRGLDPTQQFMATNSLEPAAPPAETSLYAAKSVKPSSVQHAASGGDQGQGNAGKADSRKTDLVLRILHRESGRVLLVRNGSLGITFSGDARGWSCAASTLDELWPLPDRAPGRYAECAP